MSAIYCVAKTIAFVKISAVKDSSSWALSFWLNSDMIYYTIPGFKTYLKIQIISFKVM